MLSTVQYQLPVRCQNITEQYSKYRNRVPELFQLAAAHQQGVGAFRLAPVAREGPWMRAWRAERAPLHTRPPGNPPAGDERGGAQHQRMRESEKEGDKGRGQSSGENR